ncbi:MAG: polysaccharide biosynthesis tyrosine autokinase [Bacteroidales bacterium]|nr:polysaccharide biosynthesis tyrosine autokinase [Bacteroidales bacterium]
MAEENNRASWTNSNDDEPMFQLSDIWNMIWDYIWWYVLAVVITLACAAVYLYRTPNVYSRTAKVIVSEDSQDAAMRSLADFTGGIAGGSNRLNVNNEVEAFASPDLMDQVVRRLGLETSYVEHQFLRDVELYKNTPIEMKLLEDNPKSSFSFDVSRGSDSTSFVLDNFLLAGEKIKGTVSGSVNDTLSTPVGTILITPTVYYSSWKNDIRVRWSNSKGVAKAYCSSMSVTVSDKRSSVIVLSMQGTFPSRMEGILGTLIDVYNEEWIFNKNRAATNTTEFINNRLVVVEQELGNIESGLKEYKENNRLTDIKAASQTYLDESSEYATRSFDVNNQLSLARFMKDYLNDPMHSQDLIPANSGLSSSNIEKQISDYNMLLLNRDKLLANSSVKNPVVADMNATLESIRLAVLRSVDNLIATLELQVSQIQRQEDLIMNRIASSSGQELQLLSIERQQKVKESLYIYLLQKREENEIASLVNVGNTRLIVSPSGSPAPVSPNRMFILLIAIVAGAGIPFGLIFLRKMLDTTVKNRSDLSRLSVPFLAEIPQLPKKGKRKLSLFDTRKFDDSNRTVIIDAGKRDMMNEAFRVLRTNLDMMLGKKGEPTVIMLTSFNSNSGKTFTSINLAASMAIKKDRTILIDLDLRKAALSKAMNGGKHGISSYLNEQTDDFRKFISSVTSNMDFLPVGVIPPNPAELLLSDRFRNMIEALKKEYKYIILDCPPVDVVADTAIIADAADMTVLVMRAGMMDKKFLHRVDELYTEGRYRRMVVLLNGVEAFHSKYGHYGYGYGYGYGKGE